MPNWAQLHLPSVLKYHDFGTREPEIPYPKYTLIVLSGPAQAPSRMCLRGRGRDREKPIELRCSWWSPCMCQTSECSDGAWFGKRVEWGWGSSVCTLLLTLQMIPNNKIKNKTKLKTVIFGLKVTLTCLWLNERELRLYELTLKSKWVYFSNSIFLY